MFHAVLILQNVEYLDFQCTGNRVLHRYELLHQISRAISIGGNLSHRQVALQHFLGKVGILEHAERETRLLTKVMTWTNHSYLEKRHFHVKGANRWNASYQFSSLSLIVL